MRIGVDIGGTKIAAGVISSDGAVMRRDQIPTPRSGGGGVMAAAVGLVRQLVADFEVLHGVPVLTGIGIGAPGVVDVASGVVISATEVLFGWAGTDVAGPLREAMGVPVAVENDVRVAALGESQSGAGAGVDRLLVASIGTGVGGAFVFDGALQRGGHATAGEIAHLLVHDNGPIPCGCGRFDHLEAHACGPAIAASYHASTVTHAVDRMVPTLPEVVRLWRSGDRNAARVITDAARLIGRTLAGLAVAVDVDAVVVTGGVAGIGEDFVAPLRAALHESAIGELRQLPVLAGTLGTDAPLIGAASLIAP